MIQYKLTEKAKFLKDNNICDCTPVRGSANSAGMDLKACLHAPISIFPYETIKIGLGVHVFLGTDQGFFNIWNVESSKTMEKSERLKIKLAGLYLPRSSNKGLQLENTIGLLDCDYQGESFAKLYNKTEESIIIKPGDRIVQLVVMPVIMDDWEEVNYFKEETVRGEGGDGSTGGNHYHIGDSL